MNMIRKLLVTTLLVSMVIAGGVMISSAQEPDGSNPKGRRGDHMRNRPDKFFMLDRMLSKANASALTSDQKTKLEELINKFRDENKPPTQDTNIDAARLAYANAILAGDVQTAQTQASLMYSARSESMLDRQKSIAEFQIAVLSVLNNGGQLETLKSSLGPEKLVFMIGSMAMGPMRHQGFPRHIKMQSMQCDKKATDDSKNEVGISNESRMMTDFVLSEQVY